MNEPVAQSAPLKEVSRRCCTRVYDGTFSGHMCQKAPKVERSGKWYCHVHDPIAVQEKNEIRQARWRAESEASNKRYRLERAASEMLALLVESQTSIGGDWRERRDAILAKLSDQIPQAEQREAAQS